MSIPQERYVDIASAVVGATAVPEQSQAGRVFTTNPKVGSTEILSFGTAQSVLLFFGADSFESRFANAYFAYTSPAPVSRAKEIQFSQQKSYGNVVVGRGKIENIEKVKSEVSSVTVVYSDGTTKEAQVDLSEAINLSDVATALTTAEIATEYDMNNRVFMITDDLGIQSIRGLDAIGFDDIAKHEAFDDSTLVSVYSHSINLNSSFFSAYFNVTDVEEAVKLAELNASFNVRYQLHLDVPRERYQEFSNALIGTPSVGLNYASVNSVPLSHLPMAIIGAIDYDRTNATVNPMYRQTGVNYTDVVKSEQEADKLDKARVNYYGQTAVFGSNISFYQRGFLCGGSNMPTDIGIHANEQWLKSYIAQQWFTMLISTRGIPVNKDGLTVAYSVIEDAAGKAVNNGTISIGKDLTVAQRKAVTDISNDPTAWIQVQENGYWYSAQFAETQNASNATEYILKYTLVYAKGDFVRKVEGSHNLV